MPLFLGFLQWQWSITIPLETQTSSSYTWIVVGVAGSSRQCFSLRSCLQNQKLISRGLRQSHSLMPNPRESTFPPSFITRFCFTHKPLDNKQQLHRAVAACEWTRMFLVQEGRAWNAHEEELQKGLDSQCLVIKLYSTSGLLRWEARCNFGSLEIGNVNRKEGMARGAAVTSTLLQGEECAGKGQTIGVWRGTDKPFKAQVPFLQYSPLNFPKPKISMCTGQLFVVKSDIREKFSSIVFVCPKGPLVWVSLPANKQQKQLTDQDQWWW